MCPRIALLGLMAGILAFSPLAAEDAKKTAMPEPSPTPSPGYGPTMPLPSTDAEIRIDAQLDEPAWQDALVLEIPYEVAPGDNAPSPVRTEALLIHDDRNFYFAFRAYDPDPGAIRAHLSDRDKRVGDDYVGVLLDTFDDQRRAFEFEVNALGVQTDYFRSEVTGGFAIEDVTWDGIWKSAGRITAEGYIVEAAIPFSSLRFPRTTGEQRWGFTAYRAYPRNAFHFLSLDPIDRNDPCLLCQIQDVTGLEGITPGRDLEIAPTLAALRTDVRSDFPDGPLEQGDEDYEPGLSVRWGLTTNLNLNATVNPDFSQVEADVAQLDVNQRFALFFPEKRPFFLEGADYFATPLDIVHTRSVASPNWGLKLTGKEGRNAVGVFVAEDDFTTLILPSNQGSDFASLDEKSENAVVRYRRDLGKSSTVGVLATGRRAGDYENTLVGLDSVISFSPSDSLEVQVLESRTTYPDALALARDQPTGSFDGTAVHLRYEHSGQFWNYWAGYERIDPEFRADLGFMPRVDTETMDAGVKRIIQRPAGSWFTRLDFGLEAERTDFVDGELSDESVSLVGSWQGPLQSFLEVRLGREEEFFQGVTYEQDTQEFFFNVQPTGDLSLTLFGDFGDTVDLENGRAADLFLLGPGVNYRFGRHLEVDLQHLWEILDVEGGRLYEATLSQARVVYQLSVRTFVRAIVQYFEIDRAVERYNAPVEELERSLFSQFLFSYKLNPQTVLFLGYSDNHFGETQIGLTRADRTLFVKLGYAWTL